MKLANYLVLAAPLLAPLVAAAPSCTFKEETGGSIGLTFEVTPGADKKAVPDEAKAALGQECDINGWQGPFSPDMRFNFFLPTAEQKPGCTKEKAPELISEAVKKLFALELQCTQS